jgi:flavin-dependent dehydrogenase
MVSDAFGFIDPMLSPGVFLALRSAELLADALAVARAARRSHRARSGTARSRRTG